MKRNENIVLLSREHHHDLLFSYKIKQGIKLNVHTDRIFNYVNYFWENHLLPHFNDEENYLFILSNNDLILQAKSDHLAIKKIIYDLKNFDNSNLSNYALLAKLVESHVRFEERILFPHLEVVLTAEQLIQIGIHLEKSNSEYQPDNYLDRFWVETKTI